MKRTITEDAIYDEDGKFIRYRCVLVPINTPNVIAQKISPTEAIVITRPYTREAQYYYYFHIGGKANG